MSEEVTLWIVGGATPVCDGHLESLLDEPRWIAEPEDYDAWRLGYAEEMSCRRCKGGLSRDSGGDSMDADLLREDGYSRPDGGGLDRTSGEEIARQFASYLRHPSVAE